MSDELETPFEPEKEKGTSFDLLPSGKYKAEIVQANCGRTKNGRAQSVKLRWAVTEGEFENRLLFQDIIVEHDESEEAQRIGREKFKDVCAACGITEPVTKLDVLLYKPCVISVMIEKGKEEFPDRNKVARVLPVTTSGNGGATARKGASEKEIPWE
jgi:hypothetical protein